MPLGEETGIALPNHGTHSTAFPVVDGRERTADGTRHLTSTSLPGTSEETWDIVERLCAMEQRQNLLERRQKLLEEQQAILWQTARELMKHTGVLDTTAP